MEGKMIYKAKNNLKRKGTIILLLLAAVLPNTLNAEVPEEEKAVITVVKQFFEVLETRDTELAKKILIPEGQNFSIRENEKGVVVKQANYHDLIDSLKKNKANYKEVMQNPKVLIHKRIAVLWADYKFYIDGKFSHCGVDAFSLLKTADGWKIAGIVYTVEKTGCR
jgi:hypothetical protein